MMAATRFDLFLTASTENGHGAHQHSNLVERTAQPLSFSSRAAWVLALNRSRQKPVDGNAPAFAAATCLNCHSAVYRCHTQLQQLVANSVRRHLSLPANSDRLRNSPAAIENDRTVVVPVEPLLN